MDASTEAQHFLQKILAVPVKGGLHASVMLLSGTLSIWSITDLWRATCNHQGVAEPTGCQKTEENPVRDHVNPNGNGVPRSQERG